MQSAYFKDMFYSKHIELFLSHFINDVEFTPQFEEGMQFACTVVKKNSTLLAVGEKFAHLFLFVLQI